MTDSKSTNSNTFKKHNWRTLVGQNGNTKVTLFISSEYKEDGVTLYPPKIDVREEFTKRDGTPGTKYYTLPVSLEHLFREAMDIRSDIKDTYFSKSANVSGIKVPDGMEPVKSE